MRKKLRLSGNIVPLLSLKFLELQISFKVGIKKGYISDLTIHKACKPVICIEFIITENVVIFTLVSCNFRKSRELISGNFTRILLLKNLIYFADRNHTV